ncbi:MAG: primosomal protein N' [Bacillati bacterium ANGP1]|uniref:Primosomal protein N n=1 Tax=Candidatus Segetimicrobium genomatis TaxID=2569760 RepID=A0A537M7M7_9BACT|nr:MAG: primosomal protein N' [Terrabacteria group bacterium ANGP1]
MRSDPGGCAEVLLDLPARSADRRLTYRIPDPLHSAVRIGSRVLVPLGPRTAPGFVIALAPSAPALHREIREILAVEDQAPLFPQRMLDLAGWVAEHTVSTLIEAIHCLAPPGIFRRRASPRARAAGDPAWGVIAERPLPRPVESVSGALESGVPERATLVWAEGGARRAWIRDAALATVERGGQALIAVPEIALVPLLLDPLRPALGERALAFHSGMTERERRAAWGRIASGEIAAAVGTRSALFAPFDRVRLIVVDEEHDPAHQADAAPRYHARDVALRRGALEGARVVLASSTPSVETYAAVDSGRMDCVRLPPAAAPARVTLVDLRLEWMQGRRGLLSPPLVAAIHAHLRAGGGIALFVGRTGYARILRCSECGFTVRCPRCEVTMPYDRESRSVSCRICGDAVPAPGACPRCGGVGLRGIGHGTARVEEIIRRLFPALAVARVDRDTAPQFERVASAFASGRIRLVVGTQMLLRAREIRPTSTFRISARRSVRCSSCGPWCRSRRASRPARPSSRPACPIIRRLRPS